MIREYNGSGRRILTFPAVHPCENVAPTTLLASLIDLAHNVCSYKSKVLSGNARNVRGTVRQVSNFLLFLEELRVFGSGLPDSVVLGLSELHVVLQKFRYLLEDCNREGARLWMLMKAEQVAGRLRDFSLVIATGLDVLPLGSLDLSNEVKEVIELVSKQAHRARFEVDPDDKRVIQDVTSILEKFQDGLIPDRSDIKRILDYVGVEKWSDCHKEVKFFEAEIGMVSSPGLKVSSRSQIGMNYSNEENRRELALLSSLMGFMSYSRCLIFDSVDSRISQQLDPEGNFGSKLFSCLNIDDFRCPISLELMKDPVTIETGHTYDRSSILKWFRSGNPTCPKTGNKVASTELVPNVAVRRLVQEYCVEIGIPVSDSNHKNRDILRTVVAGSLAAEGAMKMVANFLAGRLGSGACADRNKAAYEVRLLSKTSIFNRSCLVEAGVIPLLLELLLSRDSVSQENAIAALLNLSKHSKSKAAIVENGGLRLIVDVLKKGLKMEARQHAAATIFYLASIENYRNAIGESTEAIPALLDMVKHGNDRGKKNALVSIYGLLMHHCNHWRVLEAGAVPLLLDLLIYSEREDLVTDSSAVLAALAEKPEGAKAILHCCAMFQIVGTLVSSTSRATKEHCVSLLLALCINGGADVVALLMKSSSLMGSLYSLLTEGTSRASKKASSLIRILHEFYDRSSTVSETSVFAQERPVHVW